MIKIPCKIKVRLFYKRTLYLEFTSIYNHHYIQTRKIRIKQFPSTGTVFIAKLAFSTRKTKLFNQMV